MDSETARDALLRRIGRNVVNFQYLEAALRSMIPVLSSKGALSEIDTQRTQARRKHKKSSLGSLVSAYHAQLLGGVAEEEVDTSLSEPSFSISLRMGGNPEHASHVKRALTTLVRERNRLVHFDLLTVDFSSSEQCEALATQMDEQNARIRQQFEQLRAIQSGMREAAKDVRRFIESEEFLSILKGESA